MSLYEVSGLAAEGGEPIPGSVAVEAAFPNEAKRLAAQKVGGYWTEETTWKIVEPPAERYPIRDTAPGLAIEQVFAEPGAAPAENPATRTYIEHLLAEGWRWSDIAGRKSAQVKTLKRKIKRLRGLIHTETALVEAERDAWRGRCEAARDELATARERAMRAEMARINTQILLVDQRQDEAIALKRENAQIRRELDELERQNAQPWIDRCIILERELLASENRMLGLLQECQFKDGKIAQLEQQRNDCADDYRVMAEANRVLARLGDEARHMARDRLDAITEMQIDMSKATKAADDAIAQRDQLAAILREIMDSAPLAPGWLERAEAALLAL